MLIDGSEGGADLRRIDEAVQAADAGLELAEQLVGETSGAILVFRTLLPAELHRLRGGVDTLELFGVIERGLGPQILPADALEEPAAIEELGLEVDLGFLRQCGIRRGVLAQGLAHADHGPEGAEVDGRAHGIGSPELDVVGVVVGFNDRAEAVRVPRRDAIVEALPHPRPEAAQPCRVARHAPVAVHPHEAAELAVGGGRPLMGALDGLDRQRGAEGLIAAFVLTFAKLGLAKSPLQIREKMGKGLGVIPDMGARTVAASALVVAALPRPEPAVLLSEHCWRLQDAQVRGYRLDRFRGQVGVVEAVREPLRLGPQIGKFPFPESADCCRIRKHRRVPRSVVLVAGARRITFACIVAPGGGGNADARRRHVPREKHRDGFGFPGRERERHHQAGSGRRGPVRGSGTVGAETRRDVLPDHRQGIEPSAAKPSAVDLCGRVRRNGGEPAFCLRLVRQRLLGERKSIRQRFDGRQATVALCHEVFRVERIDAVEGFGSGVAEREFKRGHRQAGMIGVARQERAPRLEQNAYGQARIVESDVGEGETAGERGPGEPREPVGGAAAPACGSCVFGPFAPEFLPAWHGPFEDARCSELFDPERGKHPRGFVEGVRPMVQ